MIESDGATPPASPSATPIRATASSAKDAANPVSRVKKLHRKQAAATIRMRFQRSASIAIGRVTQL